MGMRVAGDDAAARVGVAILARAPVAGQAKTRLIPALGEAGAAHLQDWLIRRTVGVALEAAVGPVTIWCAGEAEHAAFAPWRDHASVVLRRQAEGDLGARMLAAVRASPTLAGALVIGTDCPALVADDLRVAAQALDRNDAVLFPAEDGGYVLIGLRRAVGAVFAGIDWGTPAVAEQTRARLALAGCTWTEPRMLWDVDRPDDLERLYAIAPEVRAHLGLVSGRPCR
jgi:hypothetical protein